MTENLEQQETTPEATSAASAIESAIDQIGIEPEAAPEQPAAEPAAEAAPADQAPEPEAGADEHKPVSKLAAMLDELSEEPAESKPDQEKPAGHVPDAGKKAEPKAPEAEEAELLEGVKSERGRERIKRVFEEKKALEQDLHQFRQLVQSTGMDAQQFGQMLEFGRLANSGDEKQMRVALEMIEQQRAMLAAKLGVEAPGVDLLAGHDDLRQAVESLEITRERAIELAKYRKQQAEVQQRQQAEQQSIQQRQQFEQKVNQAAASMEAYLQTRAKEVDHPVRLRAIAEHFKNPENMQRFVSTFQPEQWPAAIQMMYDNIQVPRAAAMNPQPIRSRPGMLGSPAPSANEAPIDRVAKRLESMGL